MQEVKTETEVSEGNRIIAEFMGFDYNRTIPGHGGETIITLSINDCRYHSSWDWLMPVVEKIEGMPGVNVFIKGRSTEIFWYGYKQADKIAGNKITATWQAVVKFIKWYNSNNPTS